MKRSILQTDEHSCFLCERNGNGDPLEKHHAFGASNRWKSEEDGLFVYLCGCRCHRDGPFSAHQNADPARYLHEIAQEAWEREYGSREGFLARYGKNYLTAP